MKKKQSSSTARGMALMRAIEASRPENERICNDPLARALVDNFSFFSSKLMINSGIYSRFFKGVREFITVRERYIDDFLKARLSEGLDQVVILGAGFDTRAYRIAGIEKIRVFEIDHPATQQDKLKRLRKVVDPLPKHVTFLPIDFNTQTLGERLPSSGYQEQSKTLFIWQGVTMYLNPEAVDDTLTFIARHSQRDSAAIFDYFYSQTLRDMKVVKWITSVLGESLIFGIDPDQIEQFLTQRGFHDVHSASPEELKRLYLTGPNAGRPITPGVAIASARVKGV